MIRRIERLYQTYKDIAAVYIVYVSEAHASNGGFPFPASEATEFDIKEHTSYHDRCRVAQRLVDKKQLTVPFLADGMDNRVANIYLGHPDRLYLVRTDGRLAIAGEPGPDGFAPALRAAETWLEQFKRTGREPELAHEADLGE